MGGRKDQVMCVYCDLKVDGWKECDDPLVMHQKLSPCCVFVKEWNSSRRNTTIKDDSNTVVSSTSNDAGESNNGVERKKRKIEGYESVGAVNDGQQSEDSASSVVKMLISQQQSIMEKILQEYQGVCYILYYYNNT